MKSLKDILAEGVAVSSDFKLVNSVDSQGRPTTRKVRAHRKTINPVTKDPSEEKPDVLTSIQKFVGRQYGEEVESVAEGYNDLGPEYGGAGRGRSADAMETAKLTRQAKAAAAKAGKTFNTSAEYRLWHMKQKSKKQGVKEEFESVEEGRNDTPVPYGSLSNRPSSATVAQTGPRKGMITKKHATRLKDRIKASLNKEEVELDEVSLGNYKEKASQQVKELKPFTKGEFGDIAKRAIERRTKGLKMAMKREEVELDEVSTDGYHKAAVKSRMDAAVKVASSMGSDKQAKTKLDARNKGLRRLSDRTSAEMAKANSGPQKPTVSTYDGNDRGYGKGRYMGDSVELEGQMVEAQSPSMRMFKALQKVKKQREEDEARKKENEKRALTPTDNPGK